MRLPLLGVSNALALAEAVVGVVTDCDPRLSGLGAVKEVRRPSSVRADEEEEEEVSF